MQGTVSEFDPETRSGVVLLDDGSQVRFPAEAFDAGGLRLLRLCLLYTSPSPRDRQKSRMPSSA